MSYCASETHSLRKEKNSSGKKVLGSEVQFVVESKLCDKFCTNYQPFMAMVIRMYLMKQIVRSESRNQHELNQRASSVAANKTVPARLCFLHAVASALSPHDNYHVILRVPPFLIWMETCWTHRALSCRVPALRSPLTKVKQRHSLGDCCHVYGILCTVLKVFKEQQRATSLPPNRSVPMKQPSGEHHAKYFF